MITYDFGSEPFGGYTDAYKPITVELIEVEPGPTNRNRVALIITGLALIILGIVFTPLAIIPGVIIAGIGIDHRTAPPLFVYRASSRVSSSAAS